MNVIVAPEVRAARSIRFTTIGAICDEFGGEVQTGPFGSQLHASDYSVEGMPVVMPQDMVDGRIVTDKIARVSQEHVLRLPQHRLQAGDIVYSRRGDVSRFAIVTEAENGWLCGTGSIRVRLNSPDFDIRYLRRFLQQDSVRSWLENEAKGITMLNLNTSIIRNLPIEFPPLDEQRRIAAILDQADALRAKRRVALMESRSLPWSLFVDRFGDPCSNSKRWRRVPLSAICAYADDIKCGPFGTQLAKSEFTHEGIPLWGIKNVNTKFQLPAFEFVSPETAFRLSAYSLMPDDIVMTRKGTIGNCAVYPEHFPPGVMHSDLLRIRLATEICLPEFISLQLHHSGDVERQLDLISGGAVMPGINVTRLKGLEVLLPPISLQRSFVQELEALEAVRATQANSMGELNLLFTSLQHRAFRGELEGSE